MSAVVLQMGCVAGLLGLAVLAIVLSRSKIAQAIIYSATLAVSAIALAGSLRWLLAGAADRYRTDLAGRIALAGRPFPPRCIGRVLPCCRQSRGSCSKSLRARLRPP